MARIVRHVIVRGRVQGVGYRAWVADTAAELGLEGWVRNRRDGTVEAVFAGEGDTVGAMIMQCRRGPSMAQVDDLTETAAQEVELSASKAKQFSVLPTL